MNTIRSYPAVIAAAAAMIGGFSLTGCDPAPPSAKTEKPHVFASVPPLKYVVARIGGERVEAESVSGPGQDPHSLQLSPSQALGLGKAKLFFAVGMPFEESQLPKIQENAPSLKIVDANAGIELLEGHCDHPSHDEEAEGEDGGEHEHEHSHASDPHTWLSPKLLERQAETIAKALADIDPEGAPVFEANLSAFKAEMGALRAEIEPLLAPHKGKAFYVFHPAFAYFAADYGLIQEAFEADGKAPTPKQMLALIDQAKRQGMRILFAQPQFDSRSAETIAAETGAKVVSLNPLAEDAPENIRAIAKAINEAMAD